jgi:hypothetical protein
MRKHKWFFLAAGFFGLLLTSAPVLAGGPSGPCSGSNFGNGACRVPAFCADLIASVCCTQTEDVMDACVSADNVCINAEKTGNQTLANSCDVKVALFESLCFANCD